MPELQVTGLLIAWRGGDKAALDRLIPIVYDDLRRLAARYMLSEHPGHSLQATALVHEVFLRLTRGQDRSLENRAHFFAVAATIMRNLLVDHARTSSRAKRGGCNIVAGVENVEMTTAHPEQILIIDDALKRLADLDPRASRIVELRYFVGLSNEEIASVMDISERTVVRDWRAAKAWLQAELRFLL